MQNNFQEYLKEIKINNNIAIFDVDRTIINTTSWYQACICPDLLISEQNIGKFKELNDVAYNNPNSEKLKIFRCETLKILDKKVTSAFLKKIKDSKNINNYFNLNENVNEIKLYSAGLYTAYNLVEIYDEAIKYIKYLMKYYGSTLKIIFLTAGYEFFIRGVVDGIISKSNISNLNYKVIGSQLSFKENEIIETFHMSQKEKENFIRNLIDNGRTIKFIADDSKDNMDLFKIVKDNGGIDLNIEHVPQSKNNITWQKYINTLTKEHIKEDIMNDTTSTASINKKEIILPNIVKQLEKHTNKIGITFLNENDFNAALDLLSEKIKSKYKREDFKNNIEKLIFKKDRLVFLRGNLYYNWLPGYIFFDTRTINEKCKELINMCQELLTIVSNEKILLKKLNIYERIIVYSIIDNLLEAVLYILNLIELNILKESKIFKNVDHTSTKILTESIMDLMYAFFFEKNEANYLNKVLKNLNKFEVVHTIPNYVPNCKTMRELDNNISILKTVKLVAESLENTKIDYVISFAYGGITLGFAFKSYLKVVLNHVDIPELLNSHYSSKKKLRENKVETDKEFSIFKYIPKIYNKYIKEIKEGKKNIILFDNNVTTFKTIDLSKSFLKQIGNEVYAVVSAINYNNIVNYLLNEKSEILVSTWRNVLDINPIEEYVTAFNTWKTSEKTNMLEEIYQRKNSIAEIIIDPLVKVNKSKYIFKLCRIQNVQDLQVAIKNGVNMIGIHAVYPDRVKYLQNEAKYNPINYNIEVDENLPIGILELDSIKDIQRFIPKDVKQAILFEKNLSIDNMIKTCKIYNLKKADFYVQLHHRLEKEYIDQVKEKVSKHIIATVGLFQMDFKEYFWKIHDCLDEKNDYILIDMSKHQPDLISYSEEYKESINKELVLKHLALKLESNRIPIIIADDTTTEEMEEYLKILSKYDIKIAGVDMQNIVEYLPNEQRYQIVKCKGKTYQVKLRKSSNKLSAWKEVIEKNFNK